MDLAHLHLVLNHFPILGTLFCSILLIIGLIKKNQGLQKTALVTLIFVALITIPAYYTGEDAEHATERIVGSSHDMLEEHEELAETGFIVMLVLGGIATLLLFMMKKNKERNQRRLLWLTALLTFFTFLLMALIGNHGGKIRRPELRGEKPQIQLHKSHHNPHNEDSH